MTPGEIIILAGGKGTRLKEVLPDMPKSLSPVGQRRFLYYLLKYYIEQGLTKFIFCLGYGHSEISDYLDKVFPHIDKEIVVEDRELGTGGAILNGLKKTSGDTVLAVNGDSYFRVNLAAMAGFHHMCGAECTIALKELPDTDRFGRVELRKDYSVASFSEKGMPGAGLINGGVYMLNRKLFMQHDLPESFSFEKDYLQQYIQRSRIYGVKQQGYFIDIGIPSDLVRAQTELIGYESRMDA